MNIANNLLEVNKDNILKFISPDDIYKYYLGSKLAYNKAFSSPFREDRNPSFVISNSYYTYKDFTTGESGDCFDFVKKLYNINFYDSLMQIVADLNLTKLFNTARGTSKKPKKAKLRNLSTRTSFSGDFVLQIKRRSFEQYDLDYWNSYGISLKYLKLGQIYPISHYFVNDHMYIAEKYAYAYAEYKDSKVTYKIYQPFSKSRKWLNGNNFSVWELWSLLPKYHDKLIITSSRKDALSIIENLKIPSTALQCETVYPKEKVIKELFNRFSTIYLLLDNDFNATTNWGQRHANKLIEKYNFKNLIIPEEFKSKDFSDLVLNTNRTIASNILKELL